MMSSGAWLIAMTLMSIGVASAETPIGKLDAQGRVHIGAAQSRIVLQDREYAYFSGDSIQATEDARAAVQLDNGLRVTFIATAEGSIAERESVYDITLAKGDIIVDAQPVIDYRLSHQGEPVLPEQIPNAGDGPFVASVADDGSVQFYMPAADSDRGAAALKETLTSAGLAPERIAAIIAAIPVAHELLDDDQPAS